MTIETFPSTPPSSPFTDIFSSSLEEIIEKAQASIVQVRRAGRGGGTGFVWHEKGAIITNHHVVANASTKLEIELLDGRVLQASVVDSDPMLDLALLNVPADKLPALPVGDSAKLRVGELVFAIGHPWGQRGVVTAGIVSGTGEVPAHRGGRPAEYIRSDVRLAPGNSGGPLLDAEGRVVGINSMILGGDLSVAIPSAVVQRWLARSRTARAYLGVQ